MGSIIDAHEAAIRKRHRDQSLDRYAKWRWREGVSFVLAFVSVCTAFVAIVLLWKYFGTITTVEKTRETDRFGQTIAVDARVYRVPADTQTHALFTTFVQDAFSVYSSRRALQRNYNEAQSFFDSRAISAKANLYGYWAKYSPLKQDGSFSADQLHEVDASLVSVNSRGQTEGNDMEFEFEYRLHYPDGSVPDDFWSGDIILSPGGPKTDADPWGLYITHLSLSEMK